MIEVKDEILNGEPKYRLKDENGKVIYDNLSIEQITPVIQEGTPINKVLFDGIKTDLESTYRNIPQGLICMWSGSGSEIPIGWYLCNGENGTPDLRDRFIVGSGGEYVIGNTGGENTHQLSISEMPSHNHNLTYNVPTDGRSAMSGKTLGAVDGNEGDEVINVVKYAETRNSWSGRQTVSYDNLLSSVGGGQAHENRPPYYALAFIMKA